MDDMDIASECQEAFNDAALQAIRLKSSAPPSSGICQACGVKIETERLAVTPRAHLCCDCAAEEEADRERRRRRGPQ